MTDGFARGRCPNFLQVGAPLPQRTAVPQHRRHQIRTLAGQDATRQRRALRQLERVGYAGTVAAVGFDSAIESGELFPVYFRLSGPP